MPDIELASYQGQQEITEAINNLSLSSVPQKAVWFDNVASMVAYDLPVGVTAATRGYHFVNDGGSAYYYIREKTVSDGDGNDGSIIILDNQNVAELMETATGVNIATYPGDTLDEMWENAKKNSRYFVEYEYKEVHLPTANANHPACVKVGPHWYWNLSAPFVIDDKCNCTTFYMTGQIYAPSNITSMLYIGGDNKPEDIRFVGNLRLVGNQDDMPDVGIMVRNTARLIFDVAMANYCKKAIQIGDATSTNGIEVEAMHMGGGYFSEAGVEIYGLVPTTIKASRMSIASALNVNAVPLKIDGKLSSFVVDDLAIYHNSEAYPNKQIEITNSVDTSKWYYDIGSLRGDNFKAIDISYANLVIHHASISSDSAVAITCDKSNVVIDNFYCFNGATVSSTNGITKINTQQTITATGMVYINDITISSTAYNGGIRYANNLLGMWDNSQNFHQFAEIMVVTALPTAAWTYRGKFCLLKDDSGSGIDKLYICVRENGGITWKEIALT